MLYFYYMGKQISFVFLSVFMVTALIIVAYYMMSWSEIS